jgi:predicted phosphodiesterase
MHIGDAMCDFKKVLADIDYIAKTPNAYCILNGDLMDTAIASSVGDTYGANLQPMEQLKQCVKIFEPIKDKILCILPGNHEGRTYRSDGIDITSLMATQLGVQDRYSPTTALLFIRFGEDLKRHRPMCYTVYATHGSGGGRKEGGKVNRLADLAAIVDADIYIHSHTHLPVVLKKAYHRIDTANSAVSVVDKLFVNTAAYLNYGGYGDTQGYSPASKDSPTIYLDGHKKHAKATL